MSINILGKFLIGDREAILTIARCPQALGLGLVYVLLAALAREYDGEDLLHKPWHLFIPLAASLASGAVLYLLVRSAAWLRGESRPGLVRGYRMFLSLYWMTAPLAILYAIPFERFLSPGHAMAANLWLLAIVATWRVVLISRVVSVLYTTRYAAAFFLVMLFADSLLLIVVALTPVPIFNVMGGVRLSASESILQMTALLTQALGFVTLPVWVIGAICVVVPRSSPWRFVDCGELPVIAVDRPLRLAAGFCIAVWIAVLPLTQPEQILRHRVEREFATGRIREALETMSAHTPSDFPPHWDPPPRIAFPQAKPDIFLVCESAGAPDLQTWVRNLFHQKLVDFPSEPGSWNWHGLPPVEVERRVAALERMTLSEETVRELSPGLEIASDRDDLPNDLRERAKRFVTRAKAVRPPNSPAAW